MKKRKETKKNRNKRTARWFIFLTSFFIFLALVFLWYESSKDINDLSLIGKGKNVVVQIHDPG